MYGILVYNIKYRPRFSFILISCILPVDLNIIEADWIIPTVKRLDMFIFNLQFSEITHRGGTDVSLADLKW